MKRKENPIPASSVVLEDLQRMLRPRLVDGHKGTFGHALLVAGSQGMAGAAILAGKGCLHSGVGKLTLHTPEANRVILQCALPEAILKTDSHIGGGTATPGCEAYQAEVATKTWSCEAYQAVGIGPGLGTAEETAEMLKAYLGAYPHPMVLDADALNLIAVHPGWEELIPSGSILTPHVGEFQRLTRPCRDAEERLLLAQEYAQSHRIHLVLKGHPTHICTPEGRCYACPYGNNGMATPGSGDVLTGILTGLLAQGYPPLHAALLGTGLHALAGDAAAQELGEEYMLASDIVRHLSQAFRWIKGA